MRVRPVMLLLLALVAPAIAAAQPRRAEVVVVFEATPTAIRMSPSLADGAPDALRALREALGPRARVVHRRSLGVALAQCDTADPACTAAIARALGAARVLHVRVRETRGMCAPILRDGRRTGHRMLLAPLVVAGWLGESAPIEGHVGTGPTDERLHDVLVEITRGAIARPAPAG
jgi:hypothetical protein